MWTSLFLAMGWLLSVMYFWFRLHQQKLTVQLKTSQQAQSLNKALKQLKSACQSSQPVACKDALLNWGQQLYPDQRVTSLGKLAKLTGEPIASKVQNLQASLYSKDSAQWNSEGLIEACQALSDEYNRRESISGGQLEPLYK